MTAAFMETRLQSARPLVVSHRAFFVRKDSEVIPFLPVKLLHERKVRNTYGGFESRGKKKEGEREVENLETSVGRGSRLFTVEVLG